MPEQRMVVVGASLAGLRAVEAARKSGYSDAITLIGAEQHLPYNRPPLSKVYLEAGDEPESPQFRTEDHLRDELGVDLRLGTRATGLSCAAKIVYTDAGDVPYSGLIIATGAAARIVPGAEDLPGVHTLRTLDDAIAVRAALDAGSRVVVVGAGFIGSEVASAARKRGLPVTVVETLPVPLVRSVGEEMGRACADLHHAHGTDLRCGVKVTAIESQDGGAVKRVVLDDGTVLDAELVVVGIGVVPSTGWLAGSGLRLHERDSGVVCDDTLNAGQPGVYAAGDVAHWPNPLFDGQQMRLEHWTNAAEQGALAARNALDPSAAKPSATVPYFWSDWYGRRIQFVGVPQADEIRAVSAETGDPRFLALYRRGDHIGGAICIDRPTQIMKYRRMIAKRAPWSEALSFAGVSV